MISKLSAFLALAVLLSVPTLAETDPDALWQQIEATRLEPGRAVSVGRLKLETGMAVLEISEGTFVPATRVGGRAAEMVFIGDARLVLEPPDDIESGQLELYTGSARLEEKITEAVLVMAIDAAVDAIYAKPPAPDDAELRSRAQEIFDEWQARAERRVLGVDVAILRDALGDPVYAGYFAGWFRGEELGEFLFVFEPDDREQVTLGQFTPLDATEKEKQKIARRIHKAQRKGRLMGLSATDLGQWDTWLSASLPAAGGGLSPGGQPFEPELYEIDLSLAEPKLELHGRARLHLRSVGSSRVVKLEIHSDLSIDGARTDGRELYFHQSAGEAVVVLPETLSPGDELVLEVDFSGHGIDKDGKTYALRSTTHWYPHAGSVDLAAYDVTFHWPDNLDLVAGGRRMDGGEEGGGRRFERRRVDHPTFGVSFEVGKFKTIEGQAGHVRVSLSFDSFAKSAFDKENEQEILATITDALAFFEENFGPYPLDELVAVTVPRGFSQSFLGFMTLATLNMTEADWLTVLLGIEDRRTVLAHEIAHQWWGHMVPWTSYRDQWISEAMANYSAMLYARHRLKGKEGVAIGPTTGWESALTSTTDDGRPIESIGPLVLGERLASSRAGSAYEAIVYKKGALVLEMLSRMFREDVFLQVLQSLVKAVSFRPISTEDFVTLIERITSQELDGFSQQFIYGTGLPEVYYHYEFSRGAGGKWIVEGTARQESPWRYRYRVIERGDGTLDVARERLDQIEVAESTLVVPVQIAVYNPKAGKSKVQKKEKIDPKVSGNAVLVGRAMLRGEESELRFELDYEPKELWLDKNREVFGRFFNERRHPKRMLYYQGLDVAAAGDHDGAEKLYREALAAEFFSGPAYERSDHDGHKAAGRFLDARIQLQLARLHLDRDRPADAQSAYDESKRLMTSSTKYWLANSLRVLEARLALRAGEAGRAFKLLDKAINRRGDLESTESLLLLAIAARATGNEEELAEALEAAEEKGADVALLSREEGSS